MIISETWDEVLKEEFEKEYFKNLMKSVDEEYKTYNIFPKKENIYRALQLTDYNDIKIVILGQDPYHGMGQANGLAFSVNKGIKLPPSLRNIYKELANELGINMSKHGDLTKWAEQGVLLLNTSLTVREGQANSHKNLGWLLFTDEIIKKINLKEEPVIFILWGNKAQEKIKFISDRHYILTANHPSPLSAYRGFFASNNFIDANNILIKNNKKPIDWQL